jgi:hypothetical protein
MRAGNGKGLQPIIRERFSRPQDGFAFADTRQTGGTVAQDRSSASLSRQAVRESFVLASRSPGPCHFPGAAPPCSHVPMFPCSSRITDGQRAGRWTTTRRDGEGSESRPGLGLPGDALHRGTGSISQGTKPHNTLKRKSKLVPAGKRRWERR